MSSLVLELQKEAIDSTVPVTDLLRKALAVATKIGVQEFQEWIELELNGYKKDNKIPHYRKVIGSLKCLDRVQGLVPVRIPDPGKAEKISTMNFNQPISEIASLQKEANAETVIWTEFEKKMEESLRSAMGGASVQPVLQISVTDLAKIIDAVRNAVLKWALKLEQDGILGEDLTFTKEEQRVAASNVYHIQTYIGSMMHSQLQQGTRNSSQTMTVNELDVAKVLSVLKEIKRTVAGLNLAPEIRNELSAEIATAETQANSPKPKTKIIMESLHTIRSILEGTAGSLIAAGILEQLKLLLEVNP